MRICLWKFWQPRHASARGTFIEDSRRSLATPQLISLRGCGLMKPVTDFWPVTTALRMSGYRWDSRVPRPFGALLSDGWSLIRATTGDVSALLQRQKTAIVGGRN